MFKIGEFSKLAQVSIRMLRYYDELGLLRPAYIDKSTKYRLYDASQLEPIQKITLLRDLGFKVEEIGDALNNWDSSFIRSIFAAKQEEIACNIERERRKLDRIQFALEELSATPDQLTYEIRVKPVPEYTILCLRNVVDDYYCEGELWEELDRRLAAPAYKSITRTLNFSICHDEGYKEKDVDLEVCVVIDRPIEPADGVCCRQVEAVPHMASLMVVGYYDKLAPAYKTFAYWLEKEPRFKLIEISRQVYHVGPWNENSPKKFITELQMPLQVAIPS